MKKVVNIKRFVRIVSSAFTFSLQHVFHNGIEMNETDELSDVQFERDSNFKVKVKASEDTIILVKSDFELSINNEIYFVSELLFKKCMVSKFMLFKHTVSCNN